MKAAYIRTLNCSSSILTHNGKITSRYCKCTWCAICSPIRTAVRINNYRQQLDEIGNLSITTLTIKNCEGSEIKPTLEKFRKVFTSYRDRFRRRYGRYFRGVYNFECTYNHRTGLYHPHIHIIHEELEMFEKDAMQHSGKGDMVEFYNDLCMYWVERCDETSIKAQDTRPCYDLIEGFKYQSLSIFKIKINGKKQPFVPVKELDFLYQQLKGVRCFNAFGISKIYEKDEEEQMDELTAYDTDRPDGVYRWAIHDWFMKNREDIELTGYRPTKENLKYYNKLKKNEYYKPKT